MRAMEARLGGNIATLDLPQPSDDDDGDESTQVGKTEIIPVHGTIGQHLGTMDMLSGDGCDLDDVNAMIDVARADPSVERIIFDFRSPGGTVTGVPECGRKILSITDKETIAFTDSECCSGALWLAAQCQKFYATPSSSIGSVGVWCAYLDISRQMQNDGENMQAFFAGKYKLMGAYWKPLTDDEGALIQKGVDKIYANFKAAMQSFRTVDDANFGNGLCFDGEEAAQLGFTDGTVESLDELVEGDVE